MKPTVLGVVLAVFLLACGRKDTLIHPQYKNLTVAVYASGTLVPEEEYKVFSPVEGYVATAWVREGDSIHKGALLFRVNNSIRNAQEQAARALVARTAPTTAPSLRQLEAQMNLARLKLRQDSLDFTRYEGLLREDITSRATYEQYRLRYQSSLRDLQALQQQWQQVKLQGDAQLQQVRNSETVAAAQSEAGDLRSFFNGTVYDVYKKEGDWVTPQQPIALIGAGALFLKLSVDEEDLDKVRVGQKVVASMDAFPGKIFPAHITKVYPLLNRVEQSFRADAILDEPLPVHMYGLNAEANILVAENQRVLTLPKTAVLKGDSVVLMEGGKARRIHVVKGIEDDQYVEIQSGLSPASTVLLQP